MDGGDSIPGNVHEEQEDVEIVKVDCMCVKKEWKLGHSFCNMSEIIQHKRIWSIFI